MHEGAPSKHHRNPKHCLKRRGKMDYLCDQLGQIQKKNSNKEVMRKEATREDNTRTLRQLGWTPYTCTHAFESMCTGMHGRTNACSHTATSHALSPCRSRQREGDTICKCYAGCRATGERERWLCQGLWKVEQPHV